MESVKPEDLNIILQKLSTRNKVISKEKPDLSDTTIYETSKNSEEKVQKIIHKFVAHDMGERLDLYVFLEIVQNLHIFSKGINI